MFLFPITQIKHIILFNKKLNCTSVILVLFLNKSPPLLHTAMGHFLETLAIDDKQLYHRASNVRQISPTNAAFRDLLLVTFRHIPE
nr:2OG-Fe dioxygenase family protein [Xenorhabdus sp. TS4]